MRKQLPLPGSIPVLAAVPSDSRWLLAAPRAELGDTAGSTVSPVSARGWDRLQGDSRDCDPPRVTHTECELQFPAEHGLTA